MLWNPNSVTSESSDSVYASPKRSNLLCGGIKNLGSNRVAAARGIQFDHIFRNQLFSFEVNVRLLNKSLNRYDMSTNLDIRKSMTSGNGGSTTLPQKGWDCEPEERSLNERQQLELWDIRKQHGCPQCVPCSLPINSVAGVKLSEQFYVHVIAETFFFSPPDIEVLVDS